MDQAFDARLQFDESAVVRDVGDATREAGVQRVLRLDALPRIVQQLLHAERDTVGLVVDLDDLDLDGLTDGQHFGRVVHATPCDVGDMQQAVDAAEIHERTVIGDVLDDAVNDLALFEVLHQFLTLFGAGLFENRAARHHDVAAAAIILRIWNGCELFISGATSRIGRMSTWERGRKATAPSRSTVKPPLTWLKMTPWTFSLLLKAFSSLPQLSSATGFVTRQHGFAERIFDPVEKHFDLVANLEFAFAAGHGEFTQRHAAFRLQADVDDGHVLFNRDNNALDDGAFLQFPPAKDSSSIAAKSSREGL